jgi:glycosyltransferase involved in cell wall biosynthesis
VSEPDESAVSVVIATYNRAGACERALRSALEQTVPPLEVLVCDNGSTDATATRIGAWERRDPRVRYLRLPLNTRTPASTRNLGLEHARGRLVAFLDDDDEWLPGKLAAQTAAAKHADVVATNARRSSGGLYFERAPATWRPTRMDMLHANPIITSSVLLEREALLAAGGFPTDPRLRGLEDYAAWLKLARLEARFLVLGEALVCYSDAPGGRLSLERARIQLALARLVWTHALERPIRAAGLRAAIRHSAGVMHVLGAESLARVRTRGNGGPPSSSGPAVGDGL